MLLAHPDSTLQTFHLWAIRKKMQEHYGWTPEKLEKALNEEGVYMSEEDNDDVENTKNLKPIAY